MSSKAGVMAGPHYAHLPVVLGAFWAQFSPSINACLCLEAGGLVGTGRLGARRLGRGGSPTLHSTAAATRDGAGLGAAICCLGSGCPDPSNALPRFFPLSLSS